MSKRLKIKSILYLVFFLTYSITMVNAEEITWQYKDLKGLDPWGDVIVDYADLVAVYGTQTNSGLAFRVDLLNIEEYSEDLLCIAVDFKEGGNKHYSLQFPAIQGDIDWDLLIRFSMNGSGTLFDTDFQELSTKVLSSNFNLKFDYALMEIDTSLFIHPDSLWQIQAVTLNKDGNSLLDKTDVFSSQDSTGRGKLVLFVSNCFTGYGPHAVSWYDGFAIRAHERPGERRGFKYLLDSFENHNVPMVLGDMRIETFPANEYLEINDRIRHLNDQDLCDVLSTLTYGHFTCWQPDDVDTKAMELMAELRNNLSLPISSVFFPYESMITAGDIKAIKEAGYQAIYGLDQYRYWFGWLDDWNDMNVVKEGIESLRKIHRINDIDFFFHTSINNYQGFVQDERWEAIDWSTWSEYNQYEGTDKGLHLWWRRILQDMAMDDDQEQFFTIGTDLLLTPWFFPDIIEQNITWIAAHPWIEPVTFENLLNRDWNVIDHGDLGLDDDEFLIRYQPDGDIHYNAYFPQFYYGGIADGHSPNIAAGQTIEAYADYIPYLRDGEKIPSAKSLGDDETIGTLIYKTLNQLRSAPDNAITDLAWLAWFLAIAEQTFHAQTDYAGGQEAGNDWGGQYLHPVSKLRANYVNQVNKLMAAAEWADQLESGVLTKNNVTTKINDYDLDGEDEIVLSNNQIWCLFENDGGRLEYAFSWTDSTGPVQLVAPTHQHQLIFDGLNRNFESGEISALPTWDRAVDGCFVEDFSYPVYTMILQNDTLIMTSPGGTIQKAITLDGMNVNADYLLNGISQVNPGFGFTVNLMETYGPDWLTLYTKIEENDLYGWSCSAGGQVSVDLSDPNTALVSMDAFSDSPADEEMQERLSYDEYPNGHWFNFPYRTISTIGISPFRMTLKLGRDTTSETKVNQMPKNKPDQFEIIKAYPNPFNGQLNLQYSLTSKSDIRIAIFDITGRCIKEFLNQNQYSGIHNEPLDLSELSSGIYVIQISSTSQKRIQKISLIK